MRQQYVLMKTEEALEKGVITPLSVRLKSEDGSQVMLLLDDLQKVEADLTKVKTLTRQEALEIVNNWNN